MAEGLRASRQELERFVEVRAPAGFAPPPPSAPGPALPPAPGTIVLGPDGTPARPVVSTPSPAGGIVRTGGGDGGGGGASGGGSSLVNLSGRTADPWLESTNGSVRVPLSWVEANCHLVDQPILNALGAPTGRTQQVWNCGDLGTFIPYSEAPTVSGRGSGGGSSVGGGRGRSTSGPLKDPYGRGDPYADNGVFGPNFDPYGTRGIDRRNPYGTKSGGQSSGPTSITGDVRAPGVEQELRRTNTLLERSLRADDGAALRSAGGL